MKCRICNYEWNPKKDKPKQCPKCKRYDYDSKSIRNPNVPFKFKENQK